MIAPDLSPANLGDLGKTIVWLTALVEAARTREAQIRLELNEYAERQNAATGAASWALPDGTGTVRYSTGRPANTVTDEAALVDHLRRDPNADAILDATITVPARDAHTAVTLLREHGINGVLHMRPQAGWVKGVLPELQVAPDGELVNPGTGDVLPGTGTRMTAPTLTVTPAKGVKKNLVAQLLADRGLVNDPQPLPAAPDPLDALFADDEEEGAA